MAQRVSPASLYFVGLPRWGTAFCSDLGKITEAYVGEQFGLLNPPVVLHDVEYKKGQHAADYVIGYPGLTLIVEVKSARVAQPGRLDINGYLADAEKDVGKAMKQITRTADLIKAQDPAFQTIDPTTEIRGIVVTAEPHYMRNSPMFRSSLTGSSYPTVIVSLSELEFAVSAALAGDPAGLFRGLTDWGPNGIDANEVASPSTPCSSNGSTYCSSWNWRPPSPRRRRHRAPDRRLGHPAGPQPAHRPRPPCRPSAVPTARPGTASSPLGSTL